MDAINSNYNTQQHFSFKNGIIGTLGVAAGWERQTFITQKAKYPLKKYVLKNIKNIQGERCYSHIENVIKQNRLQNNIKVINLNSANAEKVKKQLKINLKSFKGLGKFILHILRILCNNTFEPTVKGYNASFSPQDNAVVCNFDVKNSVINLTAEQKQSILGNTKAHNQNTGLKVEKTTKKPTPRKTIYLQSGRKVVYFKLANGKIGMKYYGADGTPIKPNYFKKVEGQISISADGKSYTITKNGKKTTLKAKNPDKGAIDQNFVRLNNEEKRLKRVKSQQGWIGKGWDWLKNITGKGDSSDKAQQQINAERKLLNQIKTGKINKKDFKAATGLDYSKENLARFKRGELSQALANSAGYEYVGGTVARRTAAMAAEMGTDGVLSGMIDGGFRAGLDSKWDTETMLDGAIEGGFGGLIMSPIVGGKEINPEAVKIANPKQPQVHNAEVKPEVKKQNAFVKLEIPETPVQTQQRLLKELETAKSRDDFRRITKEIKELPKTPEYQAVKERLGGEYFQRYNEWKADLPESTRAIKNMADDVNLKDIKIAFAEKLYADKEFPKYEIEYLLSVINKDNIAFAEKLYADKEFSRYEISRLLCPTNKDNIAFAEKLYADKEFPKDQIAGILYEANNDIKIALAEKLCADKEFPKDAISGVLSYTNKDNITLIEKLCTDKEFPKYEIVEILRRTNKDNIAFAEKLYADKEFTKDEIVRILSQTNKDNLALAEKLCADKEFTKDEIMWILNSANKDNLALAEKLFVDKKFPKGQIAVILNQTNKDNLTLAEKLCADKEFPKDQIACILQFANKDNLALAEKLCVEKEFPKGQIAVILSRTNKNNLALAEKLFATKECPKDQIAKILELYDGGDDTLISAIKSGLLQKHPGLLRYITSEWENIIKQNLMEHPLFESNMPVIRSLIKAKNNNIVELHNTLIKDAQANKDLLKSGLDDITDVDINKVMNSENAVKTIDTIGLGNTEAAFPLMLDEFECFTQDVAQLNNYLSPKNKELLAQKLTPECSEKYNALNQEVINLKKQLNEVVGAENLAKIKSLQAQKTKIDEQMKSLKQSDNANTPEVKQQLKEMQKQSKALGAQAQAIYYQGENANQVKEIMKQISTKSKELKTFVQEKTGLEPQDVVTKVRVLSVMQEISTQEEMAEFINMIKSSTPENNAVWNNALNKKIFQKLGVEFDEQLSQKLDLVNCKYLSKMFVSSDAFFNNMRILVDTIKESPELTIEQALDRMPQNIETKNMYKELGIDYNKWTKIDKNSYTSVEIKLSTEEAKQAAIHNLEEDLNDNLFKDLPKEVTEPIFKQLKEKLGVTFEKSQKDNWVGDGFSAGTIEYYRLMKDGKPISFDDMDGIVSTIKKEILNNNFWTTTNADSNIENARGTLYTHLIKMRTQEVDNAMSLKDGEISEIEVRKTDMYDVKKALGLGNDAQCCTALGRQFNEWSAPTYIMNKCIGAIELTDKGAFVGNTMIYIAYVDGKPALVLDNIELKTKYQNNDKIRDTFLNYAKKLCEEIGQPDLPIYAGPNRHKLNMNVFPKTDHSMLPIGSTGDQRVYLDYDAYGHKIGSSKGPVHIKMYKIR